MNHSHSTAQHPSAIFSSATETLQATGIAQTFSSVSAAAQALHTQAVPIIVGALPFHEADPVCLFSPKRHSIHQQALTLSSPALAPSEHDAAVSISFNHNSGEHHGRVARMVEQLKQGIAQKVVLSRQMRVDITSGEYADLVADPLWLLGRFLQGSATGDGHLLRLDAAGKRYQGAYFVGSSPELLIAKRGRYIESFPLAGTIARSADPVQDQARATELQLSAKDLHEHAFVTHDIAETLGPLCTRLDIPARPSISATSHTWHLGTKITGELRDDAISSLELAALLHPTPAVSGYPQPEARHILSEEEPERGFYAGAVGWSDAQGNGQWRVGIRSATMLPPTMDPASNASEHLRILASAGGGIVQHSDPAAEVQETQSKFGPLIQALSLSPSLIRAAEYELELQR
ncbi:isochorismate synthase [Corynebacterium pelargi]|uniref:Isochorismate synthase DhbC n=1 Tax=Corynebacterium pelargi TaxID=1471400 RepID=A0A410WB06_9CORY|nr:chorismate-binding protein [Corynebacterium pelargi]QAU53135.1 Isochorismate synthase DhbC [Corynebacterium pelargi]GGG74647.1 hypothetical protein GCM10007338_10030 [Corynebacterium pelargi]